MKSKITLCFLWLTAFLAVAQNGEESQLYSGFTSRSFFKFSQFLTAPTFSLIYQDHANITALVRNANVSFEDSPRIYLLSYSGRMRENVGGGIAFFQQQVGVFKDFGATVNYAYGIRTSERGRFTLGFNFEYSRRSVEDSKSLSGADPTLQNFQDIPVVNIQPALTYSVNENLHLGVYFENLIDFNLKKSNFVSSFSDKTISFHGMYKHNFDSFNGFLEGSSFRFLGIARKQPVSFGYAANIIVEAPKAGWIKAAYDKDYGIQAGFGINLSKSLSVGISYEKGDLGATNEIGLLYRFNSRGTVEVGDDYESSSDENPSVEVVLPANTPKIERRKEEYKNPEHNDLSDEVRIAQDSIDKLNRKVEEILRILENRPKVIRDTVRINNNTSVIVRDTVRIQSQPQPVTPTVSTSNAPWRKQTVTKRSSGGRGGTMYYVAVDQFRSSAKARALVSRYKKKKVKASYIRDPKSKLYYVYLERKSNEKDAERVVREINSGKRGFEDDEENDLGIKEKSVSKDPVYVVKITTGGPSKSYTVRKKNPPARIRTMKLTPGLEKGYYIIVNVFSKEYYAEKFVEKLVLDGINASYFINPITGNRHVYILKTNDRTEVIKLYENNLNGSYYDKKSIIYIR